MNTAPSPNLFDQLFNLELELELMLVTHGGSTEVRNDLSIARGQLELQRDHDQPADISDVERRLANVAVRIGMAKDRRSFLIRLRRVAGWIRMQTIEPVAA